MLTHSMKLLVMSSVFLSMSCASKPKPIPTTEAACSAIDPLPYHFDNAAAECSGDQGTSDMQNTCDTPETVRVIKAFNAGLAGLCVVKRVS